MVEFDYYFSLIQGCLLRSHRENVSQNPTDPQKFQELCERVKKIVKSCPSDYDTRNIYLYLLLNCDTEIIKLIGEDDNYSHLVNTAPSQNLAAVLQIILNSGGLPFIQELVTYAPAPLSVSVVETLLSKNDFNLESSEDCKTISFELSKACYHKLLLSEAENIIALYKFFMLFKILQTGACFHSNKEDCSRLSSVRDLGIELLENLKFCLLSFQDNLRDKNECWDGYKMECLCNYNNWSCQGDIELKTYNDILKECKGFIISKCFRLAQKISVMDWMDWAEIDLEPSRTMQQCVGELAFVLRMELENHEQKFSDVQSFLDILSPLAMSHKSEDDEIKNATLEDFKFRLSSPENDRKKWMKGLLQVSDLLDNEEATQTVQINSSLLDEEDTLLLLDLIVAKLRENDSNNSRKESLRVFSYHILQHLPLKSVLDVLTKYVEKYGLSCDLSREEFEGLLLEAFNRVTIGSQECDDKWRCELVQLCLQDPSAVIMKAIEVGLADVNVAKVMSSVLSLLKSVAVEVVLRWADELLDRCPFQGAQMDIFPIFAMELLRQELLPREKFVKTHIITALHHAIDVRNWSVASMWLTTLQVFVTESGSSANKLCKVEALIAYLCQVVECCQQAINDFSLNCITVRQKATGLLQSLNRIHIVDLDKECLSSFLHKYSVMTQCYLKDIVNNVDEGAPGHEADSLCIALNSCLIAELKTPEFAAPILSLMMPFITINEWRCLAAVLLKRFHHLDDCCYSLFQAFQQAVFVLCSASGGIHNKFEANQLSCLNYCIRCLGNIIKLDVLPALKVTNFLPVLEETLFLMSKLPNDVWDQGGMYLLSILIDLIETIPHDEETLNSLLALLSTCPSNQGQILLKKKIQEIFQFADNEAEPSELNDG